jgi:hypothetical protein
MTEINLKLKELEKQQKEVDKRYEEFKQRQDKLEETGHAKSPYITATTNKLK